MRYPEFLKKNGNIGFIAPSFGCTTEPYKSRFESALKYFASEEYGTVVGPNCGADCGVGKSNTSEACGKEINDFFADDRCDVLISCGGGETMCEDLSFVDFEKIAESPAKWFMGYSDNTNLTFTLPVLCDTAAIYGPCAPAFGDEDLHPSIVDALDLLTGKRLCQRNCDSWEFEFSSKDDPDFEGFPKPLSVTRSQNEGEDSKAVFPFSMKIYEPGKGMAGHENSSAVFSGRLLGGCIDILNVLCGTRFDRVKEFNEKYKSDGIIWFLECCDLDPISLRRVLWQLREAGWFDAAEGFIFGRPCRYGTTSFGMTFDDAVLAVLGDLGLPIITDADIGHLFPMMPLISGAIANVKAGADGLTIDQKLE